MSLQLTQIESSNIMCTCVRLTLGRNNTQVHDHSVHHRKLHVKGDYTRGILSDHIIIPTTALVSPLHTNHIVNIQVFDSPL